MTDAAVIKQHVRKFRVGATLLPDPAPDLAPEDAIKLYHGTYPHLAFCTLEEAGVEGDALIYVANKPVAQTKGVSKDVARALDAWVDASKELPNHVLQVGGAVLALASERMKRPSSPRRLRHSVGMSFLVATGDALAVTKSRVMREGYRIGRISRPHAARMLALAVDNDLIAENALAEAMARPDPDQALVELACMAQKQFVRRSLGRLPTFGVPPRLRGYTDSLSRLARESVRTWLAAFHASRVVRSEELAQAASDGTRALVTLALDAWNRIGAQVSSAVARSVGEQEVTLGLWVGPAFLNGMHEGYAPPPEEELDPVSMLTGVSVELNANPSFRTALMARHRDDPAVPLLMAAFEELRQRIRTFELMTPFSASDSSMGWSMSEAIGPFAGDAITESGEITIPNELAEQLEQEFGVDVSDEHAAARIKERLAVAAGRSPVVPAKGKKKELLSRFNEAAKGDGALAPAFGVILRAIPVLDALKRKHAKLEFSSYEESWSPMVGLFTDLIAFDGEDLLDHIEAADSSGTSIAHTIALGSPVELARLAWTEVCVISAVLTELDRLP